MHISAERIAQIEARRDEVQASMTRADLAPEEFVRLSKEYAEIEPVARAAHEVRRLRQELQALEYMAGGDGAEAGCGSSGRDFRPKADPDAPRNAQPTRRARRHGFARHPKY